MMKEEKVKREKKTCYNGEKNIIQLLQQPNNKHAMKYDDEGDKLNKFR